MSSLTSTAEEILRLVDRPALHSDPSVNNQILVTDIENAIARSSVVSDLKSVNEGLDIEVRQLSRRLRNLKEDY